MKIVVYVLSIISVIQLILLINVRIQYSSEQNRQNEEINELRQTLEALQNDDIQRLITHVKEVMSGNVTYDNGTSPLSRYSYKKELYPAVNSIEMNLDIIDISIDGNDGQIKAVYSLRYLDSAGKLIMGSSVSRYKPAIWIVEKQGEDWVIINILEPENYE